MTADQWDNVKATLQIISWVTTALVAVALAPIKWIVQRAVNTLESHSTRIETLERTTVSYDDLQTALRQLKEEAKEERSDLHSQNVRHLDRIERKIDEGERRNGELRTSVQTISVKVAVLAERSKRLHHDNSEGTHDG